MEIRISGLGVCRKRKLKGGRVINDAWRVIPCNVPVKVVDNQFEVVVDNKDIRAVLKGTFDGSAINMIHAGTFITDLRKPYLKKGFKHLMGYQLKANMTNLNQRQL